MNGIHTKAFTLIELLVVISILSMLASVILVNTASVRASGRDGVRVQQIRQIDLAVKLYTEANGHAPLLTGCDVQSQNPSVSQAQASSCFAVSTGGLAWDSFKSQIAPYMPQTPGDPCPTGCTSPSGFPIGYAYGAPLAMQYYCGLAGYSCTANRKSYQLYTPLEKSPNLVGTKDVGDFFTPTMAAPVITNFNSFPFFNGPQQTPGRHFVWQVTNAPSCILSDSFGTIPITTVLISEAGNGSQSFIGASFFGPNDIVTVTCSTAGGTATAQYIVPAQ
ncbi:MAG: type II secretion system protein [Patescibacteria group bacterium]